MPPRKQAAVKPGIEEEIPQSTTLISPDGSYSKTFISDEFVDLYIAHGWTEVK